MQLTHDPSVSSYYVTDAFYRELVESFTDWQRDDLIVDDAAERDRFRLLLEREARLLDQLRFDEWLALYCAECIHWVPGTPEAGDPRREIAISFDDRRRMEDRITACAPATPGRRRRSRARCGWCRMSRCSDRQPAARMVRSII